MLAQWVTTQWQKRTALSLLLLPLSILYQLVSQTRRYVYERNYLPRYHAPVPVVVIGNISVGGTGKTPLTLLLANALQRQGFFPGIVSRGYKALNKHPRQVTADSDPNLYGDEPVFMAQNTNAPVFIHPRRALAIQALCHAYPQCNVILSDDGLQHYPLYRDIELAVIDGTRPFGNGFLLPAGPLREPRTRLAQVDFVICNGNESFTLPAQHSPIHMSLQPGQFYQLNHPNHQQEAAGFAGKHCHAIAGIGNPARFFHSLQQLGIQCAQTAFPDHHRFNRADLPGSEIIFVTGKDAVKLAALKDDRIWVLPVQAHTTPDLIPLLVAKLRTQ